MRLSLNIGSGDRFYEEYPDGYKCINVDIRKSLGYVDVISDVERLSFKDNTCDYVLASDIIEHFPIVQTKKLLSEWNRVLKMDGILEIRTPNLLWAATEYANKGDAKFVSYHIFGGQDYPGNYHYVMFDRRWLAYLCSTKGLKEVSYVEDGSNFIMKVRKVYETSYHDKP